MPFNLLRKFYYIFLRKKNNLYLESLISHGLRVGKNVQIMDGCFFDPSHCFLITIGDNCVLAPNVRLIAHDASTKKITDYTRIGRIQIENNCFIGDSTIVLPGVTIGEDSIVGAGSVVVKDIPAGHVASGNPCRVLGTVADFAAKHKQRVLLRKSPHAEIDQAQLAPDEKDEILKFLREGAGYIR